MELLERTCAAIKSADEEYRAKARAHLSQLTMPYWALGRLLDLAVELAGMTCSLNPPHERRTIVTMAADHGVVAEGVSLYPQEVTAQMVRNFVAGGAGINALARQARARVVVVDMGVAADLGQLAADGKILSKRVAPGTRNFLREPAMTYDEARQSLEAGIEVALELGADTDIFGTGEMGIGNTTPSSAIIAAISGVDPDEVVGRGTGLDDEGLKHKAGVIRRSLALHRPKPDDGIDILAKVGGFEIGGLAGLILGAASLRRPVLIDGFISTAAALVAKLLCPAAVDYMIASHLSVEKGHRLALELLGKRPLLDLDLRLGEGTGAALAMNLVEAACRVMTEVATFEQAGVSKAN